MPATMQSTVPSTTLRRSLRWRVVDIVVASVLAVAIGVVFKLWEFGYEPLSAGAALVLPGSQSLFGGVWLLAGPIVAIVVRKPGAALYAEMVAASVEALLGTQWGWLTLEAGLVQGLGAELVLALFLYRVYRLPVVVLAGAAAGLALGINDTVLWYPGLDAGFKAVYVVCAVVSGAVIAGAGSWAIVRALAATGVLSQFAVGREHAKRTTRSAA
ncbi:ECF transporter S component [Curtobacterium sp. C1]|uniref:ECF transporter S component n=1 Tax=Curtobacterium TaxID=2034 RepID=UPI0007368936|nr:MULTISPECIES: ECF transporter S component [Curtobacterium]KTR25172.1 membrane protein [Curtobacterium citreum]MDK8171977.1 ECF transporter S component [Curtobacterium citreum]QKS17115.1 ECF transporter S component [Curtobacterium sp. Csp2]UFU15036.1 ECF transporter S component [Curtobacterium sp. C1]WIJ46312.1 ECF transporter S component [Curtobacterium citreum]